jgi:hypothetical protein
MTKPTDSGGIEGNRPGEIDGRWRQVAERDYDPDGPGTLTTAIALAVARATGVSPMALEPPLYESVDVETIEETFRRRESTGSNTSGARLVEFRYGEHRVTVSADGRIGVATRTTPDTSEQAG